ncbi:MAG: hypothetical protein A2233_02755 [Candidatus Kerfeldbacteria bacterium RIFOXYA2_FULL_38_24]|uniref:Uncharacterized protein n=1 Tax=Candidatus Kerfeldbacteria bacterium RIFOXYB2_FULL_38_14 TaxID=1798547 RepID=A0A1G2BD97_9BACT|nr:MAG: hypothetical protein A2233_02755 [Candidatus Kerfeldbacteria bacterium RIFOXYA2_FULL_38_24]OGY87102.1 MAG: hypothetical protein A2319_02765 [Candidatus Kerfeldbacteria bacterium RIFOXYB2_FULL_38_14]OGY88526.1 MAG: hypothetical protein A2458_05235 [Candidatus Kerfeldbacteria bacterium RIFOXYC2_FULL_38_9]
MILDRKKIVPLLQTKKKVLLYPVDGEVYSVADFVKKHKAVLSKHEQLILKNNFRFLSEKKKFNFPLICNTEADNKKIKPIQALSVGSRSALLVKEKIKIKGCKMNLNSDVCFPHEQLHFGDEKMVTTQIPFGVLTVENVMREILAYCFFKQNKIIINHTPVSVFEYMIDGKVVGYGLASHTKNEQRLETNEQYYGLTIKELIFLKELEKKIGIKLIEDEAHLGVDNYWYAKQKSKLLIQMNFSGGFRGVLNSNFGNDIVHNQKLYICDFDTFTAIQIPAKPDYKYIKSFVLWSVIETLKTSLVIVDFVNTDEMTKKQIAENLWKIYTEKSLLWKQYYTLFLLEEKRLHWNSEYVKQALEDVLTTEVFCEMILDNVINSKVIKETYPPKLSFYTPQGI